MGNRKNLPQPGNPNPALSLNAKIFYRKKVAPPLVQSAEKRQVSGIQSMITAEWPKVAGEVGASVLRLSVWICRATFSARLRLRCATRRRLAAKSRKHRDGALTRSRDELRYAATSQFFVRRHYTLCKNYAPSICISAAFSLRCCRSSRSPASGRRLGFAHRFCSGYPPFTRTPDIRTDTSRAVRR